MKKLIIGTIFISLLSTTAYGNTQTKTQTSSSIAKSKKTIKKSVPSFSRTQMWCGGYHVKAENVDSLTAKCNGFKYRNDVANFYDTRSKHKIICGIQMDGSLDINSCRISK